MDIGTQVLAEVVQIRRTFSFFSPLTVVNIYYAQLIFVFHHLLNLESGGNVSGKELQRLRKKNVQLEEENNLLKLKIEILLDMVITKSQCGPYIVSKITCAICVNITHLLCL